MASLNYQFHDAMQAACAYGQSKRSYRAQSGEAKLDKIFSHSTYADIEKTAKQFAAYAKSWGVKRVDEIRPFHVNSFLQEKAASCNSNTITKYKTHIESLGRFCVRKFSTVEPSNFTPDVRIEGVKPDNVKVGGEMSQNQFESLRMALRASESKADARTARVIDLIRATGLRINECVHQKLKDCHPTDQGRFGFGFVDVSMPKHGRPRRVHLVSAQARAVVLEAMEKAKNERLFDCTEKTIQNRIGFIKQVSPALHGMDLKGCHSIRKSWAQECYDFYRARHTKRETIQFCNEQLGHGAYRDVSELRTYVANIW